MSARRGGPSLRLPPGPSELSSFPAEELTPNHEFFRVTRKNRGPWWFGSSLTGRFDLPHPRGTCYLAEDDLGALLEVVGRERSGGAVSTHFLASRYLHRLRLPRSHRAADCSCRRAARFGMTGELGTVMPYRLPQAWAAGLADAGFEGLVYRLRHDPAASRGTAVFGVAGEQEEWPRGRTEPVSAQLERRLVEDCGISVFEVPSSDELVYTDSPPPAPESL
jgi:hypothetical protein